MVGSWKKTFGLDERIEGIKRTEGLTKLWIGVIIILYWLSLSSSAIKTPTAISIWLFAILLLAISIGYVMLIFSIKGNKLFGKLRRIVEKLVASIARDFEKNKKNRPPATTINLLLLWMFVFIVIPTLLCMLYVYGEWSVDGRTTTQLDKIEENYSYVRQTSNGVITTKTIVEGNILREIALALGAKVDRPILEACFSNKDLMVNSSSVISHPSRVEIMEKAYDIPANSTQCVLLPIDNADTAFTREVQIQFQLGQRDDNVSWPESINESAQGFLTIRPNVLNTIIVLAILLLAYWAIALLVWEIFEKPFKF